LSKEPNNIKNTSLGFNNVGLNSNSNLFENNSNYINADYFNNINLTDYPQKYNNHNNNERTEKISKLSNSFSETQIIKRLNKIKNVEKDAPILNLIVLSSNFYKPGKSFKIGPYGIINQINNNNINKRKRNSCNNEDDGYLYCAKSKNEIGVVYFGCCPDKINNQKIKNEK
jgi:hypothetical protein